MKKVYSLIFASVLTMSMFATVKKIATIEKVWSGEPLGWTTSDSRQWTGYGEYVYWCSKADHAIYGTRDGINRETVITNDAIDGTAFCVDGAGNWIVEGTFPNVPSHLFLIKHADKTFVDISITGLGRTDIATATGDVFSAEGGVVFLYGNNVNLLTVAIKNAGKANQEVRVKEIAIKGSNVQNFVVAGDTLVQYVQRRSTGQTGFDKYENGVNAGTLQGMTGYKGSTLGGAMVELAGKTFAAYPVGAVNYSSEFSVLNMTDSVLVADKSDASKTTFCANTTTRGNSTNVGVFVNATKIDENNAYIQVGNGSDGTALFRLNVMTAAELTIVCDEAQGTVTGAGDVAVGAYATVVATPKLGYEFVAWKIGDVTISTDATYNFMVNDDITLTAVFEAKENVNITLAISDATKGTISMPEGMIIGSNSVTYGKTITLTAVAANGATFVGWYNGAELYTKNAEISLDGKTSISLTAKFVNVLRLTYQLDGGVTNDYGWLTPADMFADFMADAEATNLTYTLDDYKAMTEKLAAPTGICTYLTTPEKAFANYAKWGWLKTYIEGVHADQASDGASALPADGSGTAWRYAIGAFFIDGQRANWPVTANFATCGVSTIVAYQSAWKHAFANPTEVTDDFILNTPYYEGFTFGGWYTSADFSGEKVLSVGPESTIAGNTLYAKWRVPTQQEMIAQYVETHYDAANNVVLVVHFDEEVCNDIAFMGNYCNWALGTDTHMGEELEGFDGWYVFTAPAVVYGVDGDGNPTLALLQAKPVQLKSDGSLFWDFQTGDVDSWVHQGGAEMTISASYNGESNLEYPAAGVYIYESLYFKNHKTPCVAVPEHDYNITLYAPEGCGYKPAIIGSFNGWDTGVAMTEDIDNDFNKIYRVTIHDEEGHEFKFKEVNDTDWSNQIVLYDEEGNAYDNPYVELTDETEIVLHYEDGTWGLCAQSRRFHIGDLYYNLDATNSTAKVTYQYEQSSNNYSGLTIANIPVSVEYNAVTYSVTSIGDGAFYGCSGLTSVTIPNSVTNIGGNAFSGCAGLTSVTLNSNNIVRKTYTYNSNLCSIFGTQVTGYIIGDDVTSIGNYAFNGCSGLTSVTIGNSVTSIGRYAFSDCSGLTSVTIPNSVTSIEYAAFYRCSGMTSISIPNSVTSIGDGAFNGCSGLTSITIPNSVTSIGNYAFSRCSGLTTITMQAETPPSSGTECFYGTNISNIYVPCGSLNAYQSSWSDYASLIKYESLPYTLSVNVNNSNAGHVNYPQSAIVCANHATIDAVSNYGYHFVQWSDGVTTNPRTIVLTQDTTFTAEFAYDRVGTCGKDLALIWSYDPAKKVLTIGNAGAFTENMQFGAEAPEEMEELVIGHNVTSIGNNAFAGIETLKKVTIGESVKTIGEQAFYNCVNLETIYNYRATPTNAYSTAFDGVDKFECELYVLPNSINMYQNASVWRDFYHTYAIGATTTTTDEVSVTPAVNTAAVTWPAVDNAVTYELVIKDKSGNIICTLIFNSNGQLTSIAFAAQGRSQTSGQIAGFSFTVTGLDSGTGYDLTITAKDEDGEVLNTATQSFTTTGGVTTDFEDVDITAPVIRKQIINDMLYILLPDGSKYSATGVKVE